MCDRFGILWDEIRITTKPQQQMAEVTNKGKLKGTLADAVGMRISLWAHLFLER